MAERRGAGVTQRVKERFCILVRTTRGNPGEPGSIGFILVFQVLPVVIFFAAFTSMLYHLRVLQIIVRLFARLFHRTMKISGAESLCGAANIFVGIESALVVRPYLEKMTRSELLLVLTTGWRRSHQVHSESTWPF